MLGAVVIYGSVFGGLMGSLDQLWVSQRVAAQIDKIAPLDGVVAAGYHEPSLVFLTGTKTNLTDGAGAAAFLAAHDGVAVVAQAAQAQFEQTLAAEGMDEKVIRVATIDGFNYSRGKPVSIGLYARLRKEP
jgi:hypothetical protein